MPATRSSRRRRPCASLASRARSKPGTSPNICRPIERSAMTLVHERSARIAHDPAAIKAVVAALAAQFGNRLVTSLAVREQHANTTTWIENEAPDAVVFPQTTADVQAI